MQDLDQDNFEDASGLPPESQPLIQTLQESEEQFRSTFDQAAIGIAHISADFQWLRVNHKLCEILGYEREELLQRRFEEITHPDDQDADRVLARRMLAGEISNYTIEKRNIRKDRAVIWINLSVSLVRHPSGEPKFFITFLEDITERKRLETQLLHELEERRRVEAEILSLNQRLKRGMQETHHRVKNNLQVVTAMIDMQVMEHRQAEIVPLEEFRRLSSHIRMLAMVHDILTQNLNDEETNARVSTGAILSRLVPLLKQTAGGKDLRFAFDEMFLTVKQCTALVLILNELVSNAIKHGGGMAEAALSAANGNITLKVCDDGLGFPAGFDPELAANTGLQLVEGVGRTDLAGTITYGNRAEGGAQVVITFPMPPSMDDQASSNRLLQTG